MNSAASRANWTSAEPRAVRRAFSGAASGLCAGLEWAGAAALALLAALTVVDVVGRYLLSAPLPGATELTEFGVALVVFAAAPGVCWRGAHVAVDLADRFVPPALHRWRAALVAALFGPSLLTAAWGVAALAQRAARRGEVSEYLSIPLAAVYFFVAAICAVAGALSLLRAAVILSRPDGTNEVEVEVEGESRDGNESA